MKITSSTDYQRELREILLTVALTGVEYGEAQRTPSKTSPFIKVAHQAILDLNERAFDASTSFINAQSILSKPIKEEL